MLGIVYVLKNKVTDDQYVGSTTQPLKKRLATHICKSATEDSLLYRKMREVGVDQFFVEVLEEIEFVDRIELLRKENQYMQALNSSLNTLRACDRKTKAECNSDYYYRHRSKVLSYHRKLGRVKVVCCCGVSIRRDKLSRHRRTQKHTSFASQVV